MSALRKIRVLQGSAWVLAAELAALCALILYVTTLLAPRYSYSIPTASQSSPVAVPTAAPATTTPPPVPFGDTGLVTQLAGPDPDPGVVDYDFTSADDPGPQEIRVLRPTDPAPGVAHNFLFTLPVAPGVDNSQFGDGLDTVAALNAENTYNLTVIEPSFAIDPWYADIPGDPGVQYETFMATQLEPWARSTLSTTGHEQTWLIGFSKSGIGAQDLILKHPDRFTLAASWDFPAEMSVSTEYGDSAVGYGSDANFQANYRLTPAFLTAHRGPFMASNRLWIGSYAVFAGDVAAYDALLDSLGIQHSTETPTQTIHAWTSGWVPGALAALYQDSLHQP